jgi:DNA-binding transcriptional MerR regulator/methylmalonyl-CoA mutase cobalamin-binding subunit
MDESTRPTPPAPLASIAAVERDTGLGKDTLRVWERRYGFPLPQRDLHGERVYSAEQVDKLRVLKRLLDIGHRPGKIVHLDVDALRRLAEGSPAPAAASGPALAAVLGPAPVAVAEPDMAGAQELRPFLQLVKAHQAEELRRLMGQELLRHGLARFVTDVIAPLNTLVGDAWMRGYFEVFEEHIYTEAVQSVLRNAINTIPQPQRGAPRVVLTTFPSEQHGLGLLMAEAIFALEGCSCLSLGTQTPLPDIVRAALARAADVVALSFSASQNGNQVFDGLEELRALLPPAVQIWAGGSCPALQRRSPPAGVQVLGRLGELSRTIEQWRGAAPPALA